jgi:hypothetical protein
MQKTIDETETYHISQVATISVTNITDIVLQYHETD